MQKALYLLLLLGIFSSCVSNNKAQVEYAIARSAWKAAKKASGDKWYPKAYSKALSFYKTGAKLYEKERYKEAQTAFESSIPLFEKIEYRARLKKQKSSE